MGKPISGNFPKVKFPPVAGKIMPKRFLLKKFPARDVPKFLASSGNFMDFIQALSGYV